MGDNYLTRKTIWDTSLLLLIFNLRERKYCKGALTKVIDKIKKELSGFYVRDESAKKHIYQVMDWYKAYSTEEMYRQKLFTPYFIKTTAEDYGFVVHAYSPIFYKGFNNSPMIHFAFKLMPEEESPTKAVSMQTIVDVINLNLKEAAKGKVFLRKKQAPALNI